MMADTKSSEAARAPDVNTGDDGLPTYEESNTMARTDGLGRPNIHDTAQRHFAILQQQDDLRRRRLREFVTQYLVPYFAQRLTETNQFELVMIPAEEAEWRKFSKQVIIEDESQEENVPTVSLLSAPSDAVYSRVFMTGTIGKPAFWAQSGALSLLRREIVAGFVHPKHLTSPISGSSFRRHMAEQQLSLPERPRNVKRRLWGQRGASPGPTSREHEQQSSPDEVDNSRGLRIRKEEVSLRWVSEFGLYETHICEAIVVEAVLPEMIDNSPWLIG